MTTQSENTKRIAKNTLMLYVRMLFSMLVSLYTSRVVLNALGVEDYGIYNIVGGFVAMFSLVSSSLSSSASRFITFELGRGDHERLRKVFSTSLSTQITLCLIIFYIVRNYRAVVSKYSSHNSLRKTCCSTLCIPVLRGSIYGGVAQRTL